MTGFFKEQYVIRAVLAILGLFSLASTAAPVMALDWGYDDPAQTKKSSTPTSKEPSENDDLKRQPAAKATNPVANTKKNTAGKTRAVASFSQPDVIDLDNALRVKQARNESLKQRQEEKQHRLAQEWLELYSLVAVEPLTDEQRKRFEEKLFKAAVHGGPDFESIDKFWPQIKRVCLANSEQQVNYRDLLRALFRLELRQEKVNPIESELVGELIGPERVAVPDKPPLTEDAVEAYADMTCFIYNQTHPGKTVDALDNRTVFVATLEKRYTDSQLPLEKLAMSNFALKWGKFKVLYADANEVDKEKLFKRISGTSPESLRKDITNAALDALMTNGPWVHALTVNNDRAPIKL